MKTLLKHISTILIGMSALLLLVLTQTAYAQVNTIGDMATEIIKSFSDITRLITATSTLAGLGFTIGAILKFKQHKDNPTQIPIGTPVAMLFIAAALLFLPSILTTTGDTLFGPGGGKTATEQGIIPK